MVDRLSALVVRQIEHRVNHAIEARVNDKDVARSSLCLWHDHGLVAAVIKGCGAIATISKPLEHMQGVSFLLPLVALPAR
jgi:hypothetical protein